MEDKELIEPILFDVYNVCPICGNKLLLLSAHYEADTIAASGYRTGCIDTKDTYTVVCKKCGYTKEMYITSDQLLRPISMRKEEKTTINKNNPIGE